MRARALGVWRRAVMVSAMLISPAPLLADMDRQGEWSLGATTPIGSTNTTFDQRYSGVAGRYWIGSSQAIVGGLRYASDGDNNLGFFSEFQIHDRIFDGHDTTLYAGGGVDFQEQDNDNVVSVYAPVGFATPLRHYPVEWTLSTSLRVFVDPETEVEIFDDIRLGVHFNF